MQNLLGLGLSMAYIFLVLGIATWVSKVSKGASETSRKLVHILVGNWVFITPLFTELWAVLFVPFTFIILNSLSLKYKIFSAMERNDDSLGTVYYAISMFLLFGAGFITGWKTLPFIGLLTMAYGDGFAAVIGKKWGKRHPFTFAREKSLAGTATVFALAFLVTLVSLLVLGPTQTASMPGIPVVILISLLTALLSAVTELTGKKGCDNLSLPVLSGLFATLCLVFGDPGFYTYLLIATGILVVAYKLKSITMDGIVAAILTAGTLYALGGIWLGAALLVFFILGSAISKLQNENKRNAKSLHEKEGARTYKQVLANSLPACLLVWFSFLFQEQRFFLLLAFAVFSGAASDTFSSEIGMLGNGRVFNILTGKPIARGLSGGVSWLGILAGITGSLLLSTLAIPQFGLPGMFFVVVLGFVGSILDSVLGSAIQRKYKGLNGLLQERANYLGEKPHQGFQLISNNAVNLLSLTLTSLLGHYLFTILQIAG